MATYTVQKGDTLSSIARRLNGDANAWRGIAERNKLANPNKLQVGQVLEIDGWEPEPEAAIPEPRLNPRRNQPETPFVEQSPRAAGAERMPIEAVEGTEQFGPRLPIEAVEGDELLGPGDDFGRRRFVTHEVGKDPAGTRATQELEQEVSSRRKQQEQLEDPRNYTPPEEAVPESLFEAMHRRSMDGVVYSTEVFGEAGRVDRPEPTPNDGSHLLIRNPPKYTEPADPDFSMADPGPTLQLTREQVMSLSVKDRNELIRILNMLKETE